MQTVSVKNTAYDPFHFSWKQLYKRPHSLRLPFFLFLTGEETPVLCEKILRLLPKKRLVLSGRWKNQSVILKLFVQPGRAALHFNRELSGIQALLHFRTPTPALLYHGQTSRYHIPVLVTEQLTTAKDLATLWKQHRPRESSRLMEKVMLELATQHVMGIRQRDLHFGNLLVQEGIIYSLDADSIDFFHRPLSIPASLQHLALFFSQLGTGMPALCEKLLDVYLAARGFRLKKPARRQLHVMTKNSLQERLRVYEKKVLRNSSAIQHGHKSGTHFWQARQSVTPALQLFLQQPERLFALPQTRFLKKGRSSTVAETCIGDQTLVIKRYNLKGPLHWLRRCLRPSRARHCWQKAHCLQLAGIATAAPIACIEKQFLGLRGSSCLIMEKVEGECLSDWLKNASPDSFATLRTVRRIVALIHQLREAGLHQADLKASNFLIRRGQPFLIDLDGMHKPWSRWTLHRGHQKAIQRFIKNCDNLPSLAALFQKEFDRGNVRPVCFTAVLRKTV